jgi:hypothetical protein
LSHFTGQVCECELICVDIYLATGPSIIAGILIQTVGQCKMQICRYAENSNQTTDVFTIHLLKLGYAFAQLSSRSSIMTVGTSSTLFRPPNYAALAQSDGGQGRRTGLQQYHLLPKCSILPYRLSDS